MIFLIILFFFGPLHAFFIDHQTLTDLQVIPHAEQESLLSAIGKPATQQGYKAFHDTLTHPLSCVQELEHRQQIIHFLADNPLLLRLLHKHLTLAGAYEPALTSEPTHALDDCYFTNTFLKPYNTDTTALTFTYFGSLSTRCWPLLEYLILHTGIGVLVNHSGCNHSHGSTNSLSYYLAQGVLFGCHVPGLCTMAHEIKKQLIHARELHAHLQRIYSYLHEVAFLYELLGQESATHSFPFFKTLEEFFTSKACSPACTDFITAKSSRAAQQPFSFYRIGEILADYATYRSLAAELTPLCQAIGQLDMYATLADQLTKATPEKPWTFVQYDQHSKTPHIAFTHLRHLFLPHQTEFWDITLDTTRHALITGDNGSGKSTYLNGLGQGLLLAHTLGVVPAERCEMRPLAGLGTYRFIEDNISKGTSRFYAECERMDYLMSMMRSLKGDGCLLLDEPFTATHVQKGAHFMQQMFQELFTLPQVISWTATHYHDVVPHFKAASRTTHLHLS